MLFDTHCHIHSPDYPLDIAEVLAAADAVGVRQLMCVGTDLADSQAAVAFCAGQQRRWASIGIHPHEAARYVADADARQQFAALAKDPAVKSIGECGLDYFYTHSEPRDQFELLHFQLELARQHALPVIFHVRDAFDDFWPIFDQYSGLRGVIHSFTAGRQAYEAALSRGLLLGINGIATFMKPSEQLEVIQAMPLTAMVLETDAPFLTPVPFRGTMNEPKHIRTIAEFLADLRQEDVSAIAAATTANAQQLFTVE